MSRGLCLALGLVFDGGESRSTGVILDDSSRKALQDGAARVTIQRICLTAGDSKALYSVISSLTGSEGIRSL